MRLAFADSEVARVDVAGDTLRVRFAAAAIEPSSTPQGAGYLLGLVLELQGASWQGDPARCFGRLRDGELADATTRFRTIDLPFDGPGPWQAAFDFATGEQLRVTAQRVSVPLGRGERFRASLAC